MKTPPTGRRWARWTALAAAACLAAAGLSAADTDTRGTRPAALPPQPPATATSGVRDDTKALAEAKRTGTRVEVGTKATDRRFVYANPDATFTSETHVDPVRVRRGGRWVPVDTTLARYADGRVGPRAAVMPMVFSGGGDGALALATRVGRTISLTWPGRLPVPTLRDNTATYAGVLPDVDLVVAAEATGFSHVLVVKNAAAMANPALREVAYTVKGDRLRMRADSGGRIVAVDADSGATMFDAPPPSMWDAAGHTALLGVGIQGDTLRLIPDRALLANPGLTYPVWIDPYVNNADNSAYTMVDSGYSGNSYWMWQNAGNTVSQRIGQCPRDYAPDCYDSLIKRLYYEMPSPYQDTTMTILDARFNVTLTHLENTWKVADVLLYRANDYFNSATMWANQPAGSELQEAKQVNNGTFATSACSTGSTNISFSALNAVNWAHNNAKASVPFLLRVDDEQDKRQAKRFCHDAVLSVKYNRPPYAPTNVTVSSGGLCVPGTTANASQLPTLSATIADPDTGDAEPLKGQFTVGWNLADGTPQQKVWETPVTPNGWIFSYDLTSPAGIATIPENGVVTWSVRAGDLDDQANVVSWGAPSPDCVFRLDTQPPVFGPHMESPQYMPDTVGRIDAQCGDPNVWRDGVGNYGTFTFKANPGDTDIKKYYYGLGTNPSPANVLTPTSDSGAVTLSWMPDREGDYVISVQAVDVFGRVGPPTSCHVLVQKGRAPVNEWRLAEASGATIAVDSRGGHHATAGDASLVAFGTPGRVSGGPTALRLTGESGSHLATTSTSVVDTSKPYTVSAWAKLDSDTDWQTVVSQDGTGQQGFVLGFDPSNRKWYFWMSSSDGISLYAWKVWGPTAVKDEWTHLLAGFDPVTKQISLQVNADAAVFTAANRSVWASHGKLQIGRRYAVEGYLQYWRGELAEIAVYDRVVPPAEAARVAVNRLAYWRLNDVADPSANPLTTLEQGGVRALTLRGGASVYHVVEPDPEEPPPDIPPPPALIGTGHLVVGGGSDDAVTTVPVVGLSGSFSVTVRVRIAPICTAGHDQAVVSQLGGNASRFIIRCAVTASGPRWQLVLVNDDRTNAGQKVITDETHGPDATKSDGQLLAFTFNEFTGDVRFYVDGLLAESAKQQTFTSGWTGTTDGGLLLGSALPDGTGATPDHFSGLIDDVRVYSGVLDEEMITILNATQEQIGV